MQTQHTLSTARVTSVQELKPQSSGAVKLTPETQVLCIHRGRRELLHGRPIPIDPRNPPAGFEDGDYSGLGYVGDVVDMFDSKHFFIKPGYFSVEYGAALHFKARAVVPGSRNPETSYQASFIAIIGAVVPDPVHGFRVTVAVDDPDQWDPFTDEECREYGMAVEALDRGGMLDAIDPSIMLAPTRGQANEDAKNRSRVKSSGGGGRNKAATRIEGSGVDVLNTKNAAGTNEAIRQSQADRAGSQAGAE